MSWSSLLAYSSLALSAAACQFDHSNVPIAPERRSCQQELESAHFETLMHGAKLAQVQLALSYDNRLYASYFDEEAEEPLLWFITDNFSARCEHEQLLANGTLRACRTPYVSAAHAIIPDPAGVRVLAGPTGAIDLLPLLVPGAGGGIIDPFSEPGASSFLIAADGERHFAVSVGTGAVASQGTLYVRHRGMGTKKYGRAYMGLLSDRAPMVTLLPGQLPWLFLHQARDPREDDNPAAPRRNLVCRPDVLVTQDVVPFAAECRSLPFFVEAVAAADGVIHVAGTEQLPGDQLTVVYTALSDDMTKQAADPTWLNGRIDEVYRRSPTELDLLPALVVGRDGPVIAYRIDGAVGLSRRIDGTWLPMHPVPIEGASAPKMLLDRAGVLHVFVVADEDGDGKSESLQHLTVPPCVD